MQQDGKGGEDEGIPLSDARCRRRTGKRRHSLCLRLLGKESREPENGEVRRCAACRRRPAAGGRRRGARDYVAWMFGRGDFFSLGLCIRLVKKKVM
jgi:hypothetical protein